MKTSDRRLASASPLVSSSASAPPPRPTMPPTSPLAWLRDRPGFRCPAARPVLQLGPTRAQHRRELGKRWANHDLALSVGRISRIARTSTRKKQPLMRVVASPRAARRCSQSQRDRGNRRRPCRRRRAAAWRAAGRARAGIRAGQQPEADLARPAIGSPASTIRGPRYARCANPTAGYRRRPTAASWPRRHRSGADRRHGCRRRGRAGPGSARRARSARPYSPC